MYTRSNVRCVALRRRMQCERGFTRDYSFTFIDIHVAVHRQLPETRGHATQSALTDVDSVDWYRLR